LELVAHWEETFPVDILHGQTYCWRGRARLAQNQPAEAAGYLRLSVELARGAFFETHARWLLAEALEKAGQASEAQRELERLVATGAKDPLVTRAAEKLKARTEQGR
jgi:predicted Zn-dependent protease